MKVLSFKSKDVIEKVFSELPERSREVLTHRYGLSGGGKKTLEQIGSEYEITRERVRQIENLAKEQVRKSEVFLENAREAVRELEEALNSFGGVVSENDFLRSLAQDEVDKSHIYLLLDLASPFSEERENSHFNKTWATNKNNREVIKKSLSKLYKDLEKDEIVTEQEIIDRFMQRIEHDLIEGQVNEDVLRRWIRISKKINKNPLNGWGRADSPSIKTRGVRDYMYLILKEYQRPMHFSELAQKAGEHFGKKVNTATAHNELIKDDRFILVGRGLYYLKDSGLYGGTVSELITEILKKQKALSEKEIIRQVLEKKKVKESTIKINLKNKNKFVHNKTNNLYSLAPKNKKSK